MNDPMLSDEPTTVAGPLFTMIGPNATVLRAKPGHQLRIIEEPIPPEVVPLYLTDTGRPHRPGPA